MKNLLAIIVIILLPAMLAGQGTPLSSLYDEYISSEGFETTEILPGKTGFEWEKEMDAEAVMEVMQDIESVRILRYDGEGKYNPDKLWKKMTKAASSDMYTEVVTANAEDGQASVYVSKNPSGTFREFALIGRDEEEVIMITVTGDMDMKKMMSPEIMKSLREFGMHHMKGKGECGVK